MARTLADYLDIAEHAAGGQLDAAVLLPDLVNDAGRYLTEMHEWDYLERPVATLSTVQDQAYLTLPADFGKLIDIGNTADYDWNSVKLVPADIFQRIKATDIEDNLQTWLCLEWPTQTAVTANAGSPRLAIYPTPSASVADRYWVRYRAGWTTLSANTSVPNIPAAIEPLFVQVLRAMVRGEVSGEGPVKPLEDIERSAMLQRLKQSFGRVDPGIAPMEGGIGQQQNYVTPWRRHNITPYTA